MHDLGERWKKTIVKWFASACKLGYPILVVHYEDVKEDSVAQISRMLDFLEHKYVREELAEKLKDGFNSVKRNHTYQFDYYTENQRAYVNSMVAETIETLKSMDVDYEVIRLDEYLTKQ